MSTDDQQMSALFEVLTPAPARQARMQVRVLAGHEARPRSIALEWWSLLRARPVTNGALMAAAALILVFTSPLGALASLLRGSQQLASVTTAQLDRGAAVELHLKSALKTSPSAVRCRSSFWSRSSFVRHDRHTQPVERRLRTSRVSLARSPQWEHVSTLMSLR